MDNKFHKITGINEQACLYKWAWSTIYLQIGQTSSCHRTHNDPINLDNFEDFHNTPTKLRTRQKMIDGEWPGEGCEYCRNIENAGGISDRLDINSKSNENIIPIELFKDKKAIIVSPTMIEIYFSNLCNMSCIYCGPGWSSAWEAEIEKNLSKVRPSLNFQLGEQKKIKSSMGVSNEKFFSWLENKANTLTNLNILGGEPFFQPELEKLIDFFELNPSPQIEIKVFSNLKVQKLKFKKMLDRLETLVLEKKIKKLHITASLDCWGSQQEYIRYGLNLNQWEENFKELCKRQKISLEIHGTITGLTIETMSDLIDKINYYSNQRQFQIGYSNNFVVSPNFLSPGIFPKGFFDKKFDIIIEKMKNEFEKKTMIGYRDTINNLPYQPDLIINLKQYLDELDSRRDTNWRKTFGWLEEFRC
jgi:organic radical activating enzyme